MCYDIPMTIHPTAPKFKDPATHTVHVVLALTPKRPKRAHSRTVCTLPIAKMTRLAPHHTPDREPPVTCDTCINAVTALHEILDEEVF
jgi:hypothetical protein